MKAVVISRPGGVEVLELREVPMPVSSAADRVLVRVRAAALNRADILQRKGRYPAPPDAPAEIPGLEFAGEVAELGTEVQTLNEGDRVFGITAGGAQAEFVMVPANHLTIVPANLTFIEAAAVPEAFITAYDALFAQARLQPDETVLVHAAGSGVGTAAIQLITAAGATAFGTARTSDKLERAKIFGLSNAVDVADDASKFVKAVMAWTAGRGVDVILDLVGAQYLAANLKSLAKLGRMLLVGTPSGSRGEIDFGVVMSKRLTLRGTVLRGRSNEEKAAATSLFARHVVPLLANKTIKPVIDRSYKLDEVREAHARMEANENFGKIVLEV
ncbi:MAG: NAD(P)H-quinone oxidoreductase [Pyrinomonadaceae bacterium]